MDDSALLKIKSDALRLLSFRPRSVEELRSRLKQKKYPPSLIDETIELFKKQGLLDDAKFAKLLTSSSIHTRPKSKKKLEFDLEKKGIARDVIQKTLTDLDQYDEKKTAKDLVSLRFQRMSGISAEKKKSRLYGYLKRRGFGDQIIFEVMGELFQEFGAN